MPNYVPLKVAKCKKCGKVIAEPKELFRIVKGHIYEKIPDFFSP